MDERVISKKEDIAPILKERRKQLKITQKALANFCNLSHNGISRIEQSATDVHISTLLKMSKSLGFKIIIEFEE